MDPYIPRDMGFSKGLPPIEFYIADDIAKVGGQFAFHAVSFQGRVFPLSKGKIIGRFSIQEIASDRGHTGTVEIRGDLLRDDGTPNRALAMRPPWRSDATLAYFTLKSGVAGGTWVIGRCYLQAAMVSFLGLLDQVATDWPTVKRDISGYRKVVGMVEQTMDELSQGTSSPPQQHLGEESERVSARQPKVPSSRQGASRLEDRADWEDKKLKVRDYDALVAKGLTQPAAADRVGPSLNTLKHWKKRMST